VDEQTRAMVLPGRSGITVDGTLTGTELAVPHAIAAREMLQTCQKQVTYSLLDQNGHMNNTRYMDWVDDLLPSGFHKDHRVQEFTLCYMNEAREGDEISLQFELADGPILTADAQRQGADRADRIFSAQVIFDGVL
jgi:acyl-ACP thioesterase